MKVKAVKCMFNTSGCCPSFHFAAIHQLCKIFSKNRITSYLLCKVYGLSVEKFFVWKYSRDWIAIHYQWIACASIDRCDQNVWLLMKLWALVNNGHTTESQICRSWRDGDVIFSFRWGQRMFHRRLVSTSTYFTTWRYYFIVITLAILRALSHNKWKRFIPLSIISVYLNKLFFNLTGANSRMQLK